MTTAMTTAFVPVLAELVHRLDDAVHASRSRLDMPDAMGEALRPFLGSAGLLSPEQEAGAADRPPPVRPAPACLR